MNKPAGICLVLLFTVLCFVGCQPSKQDAVEYNDRIISQQKAIHREEQEMFAALEDSTAIEVAYSEYVKQVQAAIDSVQAMESFNNSDSLKTAALRLFNAYKEVGNKEYREIVSIMKKSDEQLTEQDKERVGTLLNDVTNRLNAHVAEFDKAQEAFAKEHKIQLEEIEEAKEK